MQASNRVAVIDCGSNTFHLLIVQQDNSAVGFHEIFRKRIYVYLSKNGIDHILPTPYKNGLDCLAKFRQEINFHKVYKYKCIGTSALRSANNGLHFIKDAKVLHEIDIDVIDGHREADLIFKGISLTGLPDVETLTLDIGGGSLELILAKKNEVISSTSVNIGISVLRNLRKKEDPISRSEIEKLEKVISRSLSEYLDSLSSYKPIYLVGAAGAFEIIEQMIGMKSSISGNILEKQKVIELCDSVILLDLAGRMNIEGMPSKRADLSIESLIIVKYLLTNLKSLENLIISPFSLKEGLIKEII